MDARASNEPILSPGGHDLGIRRHFQSGNPRCIYLIIVSDPRLGFPRRLKIVMLYPRPRTPSGDIAAGLCGEQRRNSLLAPGRSPCFRPKPTTKKDGGVEESTLCRVLATRFYLHYTGYNKKRRPALPRHNRSISSTGSGKA